MLFRCRKARYSEGKKKLVEDKVNMKLVRKGASLWEKVHWKDCGYWILQR